MKLHIKRNQEQEKGFFGGNKGVNFSLHCKAEYTPAERALIEKYKLEDQSIAEYRIRGMEQKFNLTVGGLGHGFANTLKDLGELLELEETIKNSCKTLKNYLAVATTFGGQETFEV